MPFSEHLTVNDILRQLHGRFDRLHNMFLEGDITFEECIERKAEVKCLIEYIEKDEPYA